MNTTQTDPILVFKDLSVYYGIIQALHSVSFEVERGQILTLVGANGAGKSTTLRAISGLVKPKSGQILYKGENIAGMPAHEIVKKRLARRLRVEEFFLI
jgi:branched-chain amino acid transport system ATP-binding protein